MENMHFDKTGAIITLGAIVAAALSGSKRNIACVMGFAENATGSDAIKSGDVVTSPSGARVDIVNTDAEGRLTMADCIAYARYTYPSIEKIITVATLTGAIQTALGTTSMGVFGNDEALVRELVDRGERVREAAYALPSREFMQSLISKGSPQADIANMAAPGTGGGASVAAAFLQFFVERQMPAHPRAAEFRFTSDPVTTVPLWAHLDIAAVSTKNRQNRIPSGKSLRLLTETLVL